MVSNCSSLIFTSFALYQLLHDATTVSLPCPTIRCSRAAHRSAAFLLERRLSRQVLRRHPRLEENTAVSKPPRARETEDSKNWGWGRGEGAPLVTDLVAKSVHLVSSRRGCGNCEVLLDLIAKCFGGSSSGFLIDLVLISFFCPKPLNLSFLSHRKCNKNGVNFFQDISVYVNIVWVWILEKRCEFLQSGENIYVNIVWVWILKSDVNSWKAMSPLFGKNEQYLD